MSSPKTKIIVILGPTCSGKSSLAVQIAKQIDGEVISADSRQVYRGLDLGTGKITTAEMDGVSHHLLDVADPSTQFTADDFVREGRTVMEDIAGRGKIPIICGGTGFYIDTLVGRITMPKVPPSLELRAKLESLSLEELNTLLAEHDPDRAEVIDTHNPRRLVRALEIAMADATPIVPQAPTYDVLWLGLTLPLEELFKKIHTRLIERIDAGMTHEVEKLHARGLTWERLDSFGLEYRYIAQYLQKRISKPEFLDTLELRIRQYAKRQITYWKRNKEVRWFAPNDKDIGKIVSEFLRIH